MSDPKDPVGEVRIEGGDVTVKINARVFTPSPELIAVINRSITDRLEPIREEIAGLRKRAEGCDESASTETDVRDRAWLRGTAHGYRRSAELLEALLA